MPATVRLDNLLMVARLNQEGAAIMAKACLWLYADGADQIQPCRQTLSSCNSRQPITCTALENTASISTRSIGSVG